MQSAEFSVDQVNDAAKAAADAFPSLRDASRERRAQLLEAIADGILGLGSTLLEKASEETALPIGRLESERGRTVGQLRLFAEVLRDGSYLGVRVDPGDPARQPLPKPDLRRILRPIGPVAVFAASNFPLAFSVAGGDTASALAAGCPVVLKAHPGHPKTSEMVAIVIEEAVERLGFAPGTFAMVGGNSHQVGQWLVQAPEIRAVAFTGSLAGGRALFDLACARPVPIPVFAEMGSVNPLFLLPGALAERGEAIAQGLAGSVTLGVGQFCTNPGLVFVIDDEASRCFVEALAQAMSAISAGKMLYPALLDHYSAGLARLSACRGVVRLTAAGGSDLAQPALFAVEGADFRAQPALMDEVFGPATLVVRCRDHAELLDLAGRLPGQLTAGIHAAAGDLAACPDLVEILAEKAGRLLFGGFPTGVEVSPAMQHGGPYPATTDSRSTSVGTAAIERFLRPVCFQNFPMELLPNELR